MTYVPTPCKTVGRLDEFLDPIVLKFVRQNKHLNIDCLKKSHKDALTYRIIEKMTFTDVSKKVKLCIPNCRQKFYNAYERVKGFLEEYDAETLNLKRPDQIRVAHVNPGFYVGYLKYLCENRGITYLSEISAFSKKELFRGHSRKKLNTWLKRVGITLKD